MKVTVVGKEQMSNMINTNYSTGAYNSYLQNYSATSKEKAATSFTNNVAEKIAVSESISDTEDETFKALKI